MIDRHLVVVADHHQQTRIQLAQLLGSQKWACAVHVFEFAGNHDVVVGAVGRDLAVQVDKKLRRRVVGVGHTSAPPVAMEHTCDTGETFDEVGSSQGNHQCDYGAVTAPDESCGATDHRLDEGYGVGRHVLERHRPVDVGGVAVPATLRGEDTELPGQSVDVGSQCPRIHPAWMQKHHRLAVALFAVPGVDQSQLYTFVHAIKTDTTAESNRATTRYGHADVGNRKESTTVPRDTSATTSGQARSVAVHYGVGLVVLNVFAAAQVALVVALLARSETASVGSILTDPAFSAFRWVVPLGITTGALVGAVLIVPTLRWVAAGTAPTTEQARRSARIPLHHTMSHLTMWLVFGFALAYLTRGAERDVTLLIVTGTIFGAVTTAGTGYLLTERALRPVTVRASAALQRGRRELSVGARLIITWIVCTASPVAAITLIVIAHSTGTPVEIPAPIELPILILSAIALGTGLRGTILVARSVSEPVREVSSAMAEIETGNTDIAVPVYDSSEIGNLQRGFNSMSRGLAERERLRDLFGRHVGTQVASRALEESAFPRGDVQYAAVLFIDLVGSTAFAVDHPPEHVADVLNEFLAIVVETVDDNLGFINKFEGDAALAIFGAPQPIEDPASAALRAARRLRSALRSLDSLDFGIGVAAGQVFAGDIGAAQRYEYTVIGKPVNCAARLSDLAKNTPSRVMVTRDVVDSAGSDETRHWHLENPVVLRGFSEATAVATVL